MDQVQQTPVDTQSTLKDANGNMSSKRVAAFLALGLFAIGFIADTFTSHHPSPDLMTNLMWIILGGLGMATAEWFSPRRSG